MLWRERRLKMCSIMGVSTTGAIGFGSWPVRGKSLVPLPAASTIALTGVCSPPAVSRAAKNVRINYILADARRNSTTTLPYSQDQRTPKTVHVLEDRRSRRRSSGTFELRRADRDDQNR